MRSIIASLFALAFLATPAHASDWYGALSAGGDVREVEDIIGTASITALEVRGAVGYEFAEDWRGELEYTYLPSQKFDRDDALIAMVYRDFGDSAFTPFFGIGAGVMLQGIEVEGGVGQIAGGVAYEITDRFDVTMTYAYRFDLEGFDEAGQAALIGFRVGF